MKLTLTCMHKLDLEYKFIKEIWFESSTIFKFITFNDPISLKVRLALERKYILGHRKSAFFSPLLKKCHLNFIKIVKKKNHKSNQP